MEYKLGTVIDLFEKGTAKVKFDDEEEAREKEYSYLKSYVPALQDRILLVSVSDTYIILGTIFYKEEPDNVKGIEESKSSASSAQSTATKVGVW